MSILIKGMEMPREISEVRFSFGSDGLWYAKRIDVEVADWHEIVEVPSAQPEVTEEAVKEYCRKRCLCIVDSLLLKKYASTERKGKWEYHSNPNIRGGMNPEDAYCSVCGFHIYTPEVENFDDYNFCPNCGADMRGEENENVSK